MSGTTHAVSSHTCREWDRPLPAGKTAIIREPRHSSRTAVVGTDPPVRVQRAEAREYCGHHPGERRRSRFCRIAPDADCHHERTDRVEVPVFPYAETGF